MKNILSFVFGATTLFSAAVPAQAGRTAVDQYPDGTELLYYLGGYCDFNGDDCDSSAGASLPYSVSFAGGAPTDRIWVHGHGILTFGDSAGDGFANNSAVYNPILDYFAPPLKAYNLNLVSAGQNVGLDYPNAFFQSAKLRVTANGSIYAKWFTCSIPSSPTKCPADPNSEYSLLLRPTRDGFLGTLRGDSGAKDIGYVIDGAFTSTGTRFLMPATFSGNVAFVPEPSSWALLIAGFGLTGAALRRRRVATA